jgi:hypothetical protein
MKLLLCITLLSFLFPWLSFRILDLDTQPWFMIMGSLFLLLNIRKKVHIAVVFALLLFLSAFGVGLAYGSFDFLFVRAVLGYYAFFIVLASYYLMKRYFEFPVWILTWSNAAWLFAGALQVFFGKNILSFLVIVRTTEDRGVTGLAPEPTFYGIFLFYMCWLLYLEKQNISIKTFRILVSLNLLFIIFVAKSSMVVLFILIAGFLYLVFNFFSVRRLLVTLLLGVCAFLVTTQYGNYLEDTRLYTLGSLVVDAPLVVIEKDASINERASHIFFSFKGFYDDLGYPHGFHSFSNSLATGRDQSGGFFFWGSEGNKIMSGVGSLLYELGWYSILFFILVFWLMFSRYYIKDSLLSLFLFMGLLISAISISFTLLPMVIISKYFYFVKKKRLRLANLQS